MMMNYLCVPSGGQSIISTSHKVFLMLKSVHTELCSGSFLNDEFLEHVMLMALEMNSAVMLTVKEACH